MLPPVVCSLSEVPNLKRIDISATVNEDAQEFQINFRDSASEYLFHFCPKFTEHRVVRNSTDGGKEQWQHEEHEGGMPFHRGHRYLIGLVPQLAEHIDVYIDGDKFCSFGPRHLLKDMCTLEVLGDLHDVKVELEKHSPIPTPEGRCHPRMDILNNLPQFTAEGAQ